MELLKQWVKRLQQFLSIDPASIGTIGGGRRKPTGRIDVALIQGLFAKADVSDLVEIPVDFRYWIELSDVGVH
jgi:superfamily II DNA or RNA helicase